MLAAVTPATLARLRFPLGELTKPEVRALAAAAGLPVASKAESQDLCFLAGTGKAAFLARHAGLADRRGDIVDEDGNVLARHHGAHHFTVGQRKGLGVAAPEPLYVLATDAGSNRVVAGPRSALATTTVQLRIRPAQKAVLARAAELRQTSLSNFMLEHAYEAAQQVLAEQVDIVMTPAEWEAFCKALDEPPRSIPALKKLLTQPSVFDAHGKAAAQ